MSKDLNAVIIDALEELKGKDILSMDVKELTSVTDTMVVCSARSTRHLKSLANNVALRCKEAGFCPLGVEGDTQTDWILVDLADAVVHIMLAEAREFYQLEKLWSYEPKTRSKPAASDE
jgi:ribosome-associated protein